MKKLLFGFCIGVWVGRNRTIRIAREVIYKRTVLYFDDALTSMDLKVKASDFLRRGGEEEID